MSTKHVQSNPSEISPISDIANFSACIANVPIYLQSKQHSNTMVNTNEVAPNRCYHLHTVVLEFNAISNIQPNLAASHSILGS